MPPQTSKPTSLDEARSDPERGRFAWMPLPGREAGELLRELRAVLLGRIEGAAITRFRIEGLEAPNDFSTVPGVTEAVCDLVLNLKSIRVELLGDSPGMLSLDVRGPGKGTAADLQTNGKVRILTPDAPIAEVATGAHLRMDLWVETGRGYRSNEENRRPDDPPSVFPIDALFCPVLRVDPELEPVDGTGMVRPVLNVSTDGSISPAEAVARAAAMWEADRSSL